MALGETEKSKEFHQEEAFEDHLSGAGAVATGDGASSEPSPRIVVREENNEDHLLGAGAVVGGDIQCPCCFRVGSLCASFAPEENWEKVRGMRVLMASHGIDAYIVPSGDAHASEYVASRDERRAWLTGFTGSAGTAVITMKEALCWTDGRYFQQAGKQLSEPWQLMRENIDESLSSFCRGKRVGIDPTLATLRLVEEVDPVPVERNLVDLLWSVRRPPGAFHPVIRVDGGEKTSDKLRRVRERMEEASLSALCVNALDQIAWLFNLRGSDIECNPVFFSYALVTMSRAYLFVGRDDVEVDDEVELMPYASFEARKLSELLENEESFTRLGLERSTATMAMKPLNREVKLLDVSPIERLKASKNDFEIDGLKNATTRDAAVLCGFFAWLEERLLSGIPTSEMDASIEISRRRAKRGSSLYKGDSFPTISAAGPNASVIHYQPSADNCAQIEKNQVYLCDTGAQYLDGTTDVTRTVYFGDRTPEPEIVTCYTRVLQGHIDLAKTVFPEGTPGIVLDGIARAPLWRDGLNYLHGTGHGMGAYLNVHEGPFGIGGGAQAASTLSPLAKLRYLDDVKPGFYVSDEPGFYKDGHFGIRLESDLLVTVADTKFDFGNRKYLRFDYLTLVPMCKALIDISLLDSAQLDFLNQMHQTCHDTLKPLLQDLRHMDDQHDVDRALSWLQRNTLKISKS